MGQVANGLLGANKDSAADDRMKEMWPRKSAGKLAADRNRKPRIKSLWQPGCAADEQNQRMSSLYCRCFHDVVVQCETAYFLHESAFHTHETSESDHRNRIILNPHSKAV